MLTRAGCSLALQTPRGCMRSKTCTPIRQAWRSKCVSTRAEPSGPHSFFNRRTLLGLGGFASGTSIALGFLSSRSVARAANVSEMEKVGIECWKRCAAARTHSHRCLGDFSALKLLSHAYETWAHARLVRLMHVCAVGAGVGVPKRGPC